MNIEVSLTVFRKILRYQIRPVGAELFHSDGRTDGPTDRQT